MAQDVSTPNMPKRVRHRLEIPKLGIEMIHGNNIKVIIFRTDRSDTPHLTISWGNAAKEIDVHLKTRTAGGQEDHQPIAKLPESELEGLAAAFEPELMDGVAAAIQTVRTVRPGWLWRRRYVVVHLHHEAEEHLLNQIAPRRKRKGKWARFVDPQAVRDIVKSQGIIHCVYHPAILHELAAEAYAGPVLAQCVAGRRRGRLIALCSIVKPNGIRSWVIIDNRFIRALRDLSQKFVMACLKRLLPGDTQATVANALQLEELAFDQEGGGPIPSTAA